MKNIFSVLLIVLLLSGALVACNEISAPENTVPTEKFGMPYEEYASEIQQPPSISEETTEPQEIIVTPIETAKSEQEIIEYNLNLFYDELYQYVSSLTLGGVTSAEVQIRFVADGVLYAYGVNELVCLDQIIAYQTFVEPGREEHWDSGWRVIYTANTTVSDFRLIALTYGMFLYEPTDGIYVRDVIYTISELLPELPLVASWVHEGCFTTGRGISFVYDGETRYFEIMLSNKSGHLFLSEIVPN